MEKNSLTQETTLKQKTTLTPLQIQEIRILEYPTLELEQRIEREIEENPALEAGAEEKETSEEDDIDQAEEDALQNEDFDLNDYISDDDYEEVPDYRTRTNNVSPDDKQEDIPFSVGESFQEQLLSQLGLLSLTPLQQKVAQYIIGNIDQDGYLRRETEQLADDLAFKANINISDKEVEDIIRLIQTTFEPAGVAARDLRESLILQLQRKQPAPAITLAQNILDKKYKEFTSHHYQKIIERFNVSEEELRDAIKEIQKLNPKPGNTYSQDIYNVTAVVPDFIIDVEEGNINVSLNNGMVPDLRVNREFSQILQQYQAQESHSKQEKDTIAFIKDRIDSARWFIDAIQQRNTTLLRTMRCIVAIQRDYFLEGDETLLKPMILKDVADRTGYDVSTISRVSNSKYAQTPYGIFPLRYFFSESMANSEGEEVATRTIKNALLEIINNEDPLAPAGDDELVTLLTQRGFPIARRTVAKYRKQLGIPVARLRKSI